METQTFDISELFDQYTDKSLQEEATRRDTILAGSYDGTIKKVDPRLASEKSPFPGRKMLNLQVAIVDGTGKKMGSQFVEVSPEEYRQTKVKGEKPKFFKPGSEGYSKEMELDKAFKLWSQLNKVVNPDGKLSIGETVKRSIDHPVNLYVTEPFKDEAGNWYSYKKDDLDERKRLLGEGFTPSNFVNTISKVKS